MRPFSQHAIVQGIRPIIGRITVRHRTIPLAVLLLAACSRHPATQPLSKPVAATENLPSTPQIPPVEFGKRPPGKRITSENMPYFDTVKYCAWATRGRDTRFKGPLYDQCIDDQQNTRDVLAKAIDAKKFSDKKIVHCAKATRTAYHGMWYCLWDQPYR